MPPETPRPPETRPSRAHLAPWLVAFVVLLLWLPGLHDNILLLDSAWLVRDNVELASGRLDVVRDAFFSFDPAHRWRVFGAEYLPIRDVSVWLDFRLWGDRWQLHRLVNLLLYAAGCGLLMQWLRQLGVSLHRSALAAVCFAMIPAHLSNVLWLAGRKDLLGLCFVVLMMCVGVRARGWRMAVAALLLVVAIWSKNTSYSGLVWLFAAAWVFGREHWQGRWLRRSMLFGGVTAGCIALSTSVGRSAGIIAESHVEHLWQLPVFQGRLLMHYVWVLVDPGALSLVHKAPSVASLSWPVTLVALLGWVVLLAGPLVLLRWSRLGALGLVFFGAGFLPVSQVIPLQNALADRYLLLPTVGLAMMLAALPRRRAWDVALVVLTVYWSVHTWNRMPLWSSEILLLEDALEKHPDDQKSQHLLTHARISAHPEQGQQIAEEALRTYGSVAGLHHLLATQHADPAEALRQHARAVELAPAAPAFRNDYAIALQRAGQLQPALEQAEQLVQLDPDYRKGWTTLSSIAIDLKLVERGVDAAQRAVVLDPYSASSWCNLGSLHYLNGVLQGAADGWHRCLSLDPGNELARKGLQHIASQGYTPGAVSPTSR